METVRAFLALDIPNGIKDRIMDVEGMVEKSGADVKLVEKENLHVTMKFLGDVTEGTVEKVFMAMEGLGEERFEIEVMGTGVFPNPRMVRVLWVGIGGGSEKVISIFKKLDAGIASLGFPRERDFTPHITIGRVRSPRNRDELIKTMEKFSGEKFGTAAVSRVVLKRSVLTPSGPMYSNLREVELKG